MGLIRPRDLILSASLAIAASSAPVRTGNLGGIIALRGIYRIVRSLFGISYCYLN